MKQDVFDPGYIYNINMAMVMALEWEYDNFGKELVLEDGFVTEVHTKHKVITGFRRPKNNV